MNPNLDAEIAAAVDRLLADTPPLSDAQAQRVAALLLRDAPPARPAYVNVAEAAKVLGMSTKTVRRSIADGTLPARRVGNLVRIKAADLDNVGRPVTNTRRTLR